MLSSAVVTALYRSFGEAFGDFGPSCQFKRLYIHVRICTCDVLPLHRQIKKSASKITIFC